MPVAALAPLAGPALLGSIAGLFGGGGGPSTNTTTPYGNFETVQSGDVQRIARSLFGAGAYPLVTGGQQASQLGIENLIGILQSQGRTNPLAMNRELDAIRRGTEAAQQVAGGNLQRAGLGQSGVGQAIMAAIGQAGLQREAGRQAVESQLEDARKRSDLGLLLNLIINPGIQSLGIERGVAAQTQTADDAFRAAIIGALGQGLGAAASGGLFG